MEEVFESKDFYDGIFFTTHTKEVAPICSYITFDNEDEGEVVRHYEYKAYKTKQGTLLLHIEIPLLFPEQIGFQENICPMCSKDRISIVAEIKKHVGDFITIADVLDQLVADKVLRLLPYSQTSEFFKILAEHLQKAEVKGA